MRRLLFLVRRRDWRQRRGRNIRDNIRDLFDIPTPFMSYPGLFRGFSVIFRDVSLLLRVPRWWSFCHETYENGLLLRTKLQRCTKLELEVDVYVEGRGGGKRWRRANSNTQYLVLLGHD